MGKSERQSNIELLRIMAMLAVVMVHLDGASLSLPEPCGDLSAVSTRNWWILSVESITIIGVNCFTLISGYFGIKARWRGFVNFTLQCLFYSVMIASATGALSYFTGFGKVPFTWLKFAESWLVFTHTDLWYVPAYLGLYLLSPLLNAGIKSLSKRDFTLTLAAFIAFNIWAGWLWGGSFNANGYTLVHLVMVYLIGRYIGEYVHISDANRSRIGRYSWAVYIAATIAITILAVFIDGIHAYAYNSPLVLISSVALFMAFATMRFRSSAVNSLAGAAFAVYLIHKNPYVWGTIVRPLSRHMWENFSLAEYTLLFIATAIGIYLVCYIIETARQYLFSAFTK